MRQHVLSRDVNGLDMVTHAVRRCMISEEWSCYPHCLAWDVLPVTTTVHALMLTERVYRDMRDTHLVPSCRDEVSAYDSFGQAQQGQEGNPQVRQSLHPGRPTNGYRRTSLNCGEVGSF